MLKRRLLRVWPDLRDSLWAVQPSLASSSPASAASSFSLGLDAQAPHIDGPQGCPLGNNPALQPLCHRVPDEAGDVIHPAEDIGDGKHSCGWTDNWLPLADSLEDDELDQNPAGGGNGSSTQLSWSLLYPHDTLNPERLSAEYAGCYLSAEWFIEPLLQCRPLARLARSPIYLIFQCLFLPFLFVGICLLRLDHPAFVAFCTVLCLLSFATFATAADRRMVWLLFRNFEWLYVTFNTILLLGAGAYVMANVSSIGFIVAFLFVIAIGDTCSSILDALAPRSRWFVRASYLFGYLVMLGYIFIAEHVSTSFFGDGEQLPKTLFSHPRQVALLAAVQVTAFHGKYFLKTLRAAASQSRWLVLLSAPVNCTFEPILHTVATEAIDGSVPTPVRRLENVTRIHMVSHLPAQMFHSSTSNPLHGASLSPVPTNNSGFRLHHAFEFSPVNLSKRARTIADSRVYLYCFFLPSLVYLCVFGSFSSYVCTVVANVHAGAYFVLTTTITFFELARYDRLLLRAVLARFEWWLAVLSAVQYCAFSAVYSSSEQPPALTAAFTYTTFVFCGFVISFGASLCPRHIKLGCLLLYLFNCLRIFVGAALFDTHSPVHVCVYYYCASAQVLAHAALWPLTVFGFKYAYINFSSKDQCTILCARLTYTTRRAMLS